MLNYLLMQYIQYFFPKGDTSLHYSLRNTTRNSFIPVFLIAQLRNEFWIPYGRAEVKKASHDCGVCKRFQGGPFKLRSMSPWPRKKVANSTPFTYTDLDYFGPLYVRAESSKEKVWVCLFTCVAVRAIHLELIKDMTAKQFLLALRRFIARKGKPKEILLDNALQFQLAKTAIDKS